MYKIYLTVLLAGCGYNPPKDQCIGRGTECEHEEPVIIKGEKGEKGDAGERGNTGPEGRAGSRGIPGRDGSNGSNGSDGKDGSSCSAIPTSNGAIIQCTDGTNVAILNGQDGTDGEDGEDAPPTAYSITEIKDPCGDQSGFDEVLLRTACGEWIAHFSSGNKQFLTILTPGTYSTTDQTRCAFSLDNTGNITNEYNY